jgi:hypothetical protein
MTGESFDILKEKLDRLQSLFPEIFMEDKIDLEKFKSAFLGDFNIYAPYNTGNNQLKTNTVQQKRDAEVEFKTK